MVIVTVVWLAAACDRNPKVAADPAAAAVAAMSLQQQAAQTVAARLSLAGDTLPPDLVAELATGAAGAVLVAGEDADRGPGGALRAARAAAPWPLLAIVDLQAVTPLPQPEWIAALADGDLSGEAGAAAMQAVRAAGGDVLRVELSTLNGSAPLGSLRRDPHRVGGGVAAFVEGATGLGAVAVAPFRAEFGAAAVQRWDRARLEGRELRELEAVMLHSPAVVELPSTRLPALTGDTLPMALSAAAVYGLLRRDLGFGGVVAADPAAVAAGGFADDPEAAAVALLSAGVDLLLGLERPAAAVDAIVAGVREGRLDPARVAEAATRVLRLRMAAGEAEGMAGRSAGAAAAGEAEGVVGRSAGAAAGGRGGGGRSAGAGAAGEAEGVAGRSAGAAAVGDRGAVGRIVENEAVRLAIVAGAAARAGEEWGRAADSAVGGGGGAREAAGAVWPAAPILWAVPADSLGMAAGLEAALDGIVREAMRDSLFTAAAIVVGRRRGVALMRGWGREGRGGGGAPVDPSVTLFDVASLTKVVGTTTAAALLVEEGVVGLDDPVVDHLPRFRGEGREGITVRHLLTHTSGLPAGRWLFGSARSPEQALEHVLEQKPVRAPGERVEYSDLGMIVLAAALEAAGGQPIDRMLAQRVFAVLGMMSTMYLPPLVLRDRAAPTAEITERDFPLVGIVHDANAFRLGGVAGHAGLFSTARDLAVFAQTLLNGGSYGTVRVLSPATVDTFTRRQGAAEQRALGWDTPSRVSSAGDYFSARSFGHTGYTGTSLWIDPENDVFVVLLTNRTYTEATAREMFEFRAAIHDTAARAVTDRTVRRRPAR